jgi:hypothetical protein
MHRRPGGHLDGLQIQWAAVTPATKDHLQQLAHFLGDFVLDRLRRFFSCGVSVWSTGRSWQIFSLTASS